jgi:hypothetical protein
MSTACLEVPEYGAISSLPELPALEKVTDPSEAALELVSPVAERRACSEGVCGPRSSPLYVSSVPETVALPQLENRSVGRSFDCGGGSGGRAGGGGGSSWSFDRQPDPTYGFDECHRCPGQLPSEQKMASPPNRTRMGRKSKTMSPSPKKKSNYRSDTQKSHREKDEMDCLTSMMESASIANSRVLLD